MNRHGRILVDVMCLKLSYLKTTSGGREPESAAGRPAGWFFFFFCLDWQRGEPIGSRLDPREALLKSHHRALAHQQMAASSFVRETRRIQHERSRWSASEERGGDTLEDFLHRPSLVNRTVEQRDEEEKQQQTTGSRKSAKKSSDCLRLLSYGNWRLSLEEVKLFLFSFIVSVKRSYLMLCF